MVGNNTNTDNRPEKDTSDDTKGNTAKSFDAQLEEAKRTGNIPVRLQVATAFLSGIASIIGTAAAGETGAALGTYAGGAIAGAAAAKSGHDQQETTNILHGWLKLQQAEAEEIKVTLLEVVERLDLEDENIRKRIESPEYLRLLRKCFREWSAAESEEKRILIRNLLVNAAGSQITADDVIYQFIRWIDTYSEAHFKVVHAVYNHSGITRLGIWQKVNGGPPPRENSSEADLFKLLMQDLSTGRIIRQHRETDAYGNFIKTPRRSAARSPGQTYKSAFDDGEQYELTQIGEQFVHYTMTESVKKIGSAGVKESVTEEL